jgi:hypothetical protein
VEGGGGGAAGEGGGAGGAGGHGGGGGGGGAAAAGGGAAGTAGAAGAAPRKEDDDEAREGPMLHPVPLPAPLSTSPVLSPPIPLLPLSRRGRMPTCCSKSQTLNPRPLTQSQSRTLNPTEAPVPYSARSTCIASSCWRCACRHAQGLGFRV